MRAAHKMTIKCVLSYLRAPYSNKIYPEVINSTSRGQSSNAPRVFSTGVPTSRILSRLK